MRRLHEGRASILTVAFCVALAAASAPYSSTARPRLTSSTTSQAGGGSDEGKAQNQEEQEASCLRPDAPRPKAVVWFGVLDSSAVDIPKPEYPMAAKAARISGNVRVEAIVGEAGEVMRARVRTGHPVLQAAVKKVVCQARLKPFKLSGRPVAAGGIINYRFIID